MNCMDAECSTVQSKKSHGLLQIQKYENAWQNISLTYLLVLMVARQDISLYGPQNCVVTIIAELVIGSQNDLNMLHRFNFFGRVATFVGGFFFERLGCI